MILTEKSDLIALLALYMNLSQFNNTDSILQFLDIRSKYHPL